MLQRIKKIVQKEDSCYSYGRSLVLILYKKYPLIMYIDLLEDGLDGLQWQLINVKKTKQNNNNNNNNNNRQLTNTQEFNWWLIFEVVLTNKWADVSPLYCCYSFEIQRKLLFSGKFL